MALIVAEIGQNHCGSMTLARTLIRLAKENGADLAKFQLYDHKKLYENEPDVSLSFEQAVELFEYGKCVGIEVFFSVYDVERVKWCERIGVKRYKVATEMRDTDVLSAIVGTGKPVIMSVKHPGNHAYVTKLSPLTTLIFCIPKYPASLN